LRFLGLGFTRWHEGRVEFAVDGVWKELTESTESVLQRLVTKLKTYRSRLANDLRHGLFRAQAERWMQAMILEDVTRIDVTLDPAQVYEQLFAHGAGQHGIIDLLCVTRSRRLAPLELKATENVI
jgi:hypothetical protein